jgi:mechanosensitive ion channel-like protein
MPATPITDLSEAVLTSLAVFLAALPAIVGALLILLIGWIVSAMLGRLVTAVLRRIQVDQLAAKSGVTTVLVRSGVRSDPAEMIGGFVKWYLRLVVILMAANAVGITAIAGIVNQVLAFLPNLLVALLILAAFSWLANVARGFVRGAVDASGMPNGNAIGTLAFVTVLGFGIIAAADQIGVAQTLLNTLFMGIVGALALAFGLAFGLGGRDQAAEIWADWRAHARRAGDAGPDRRPMAAPAGDGQRRQEELIRSS